MRWDDPQPVNRYPTAQTEVITDELWRVRPDQVHIYLAMFATVQEPMTSASFPRCPFDGSEMDHLGTHGYTWPVYELACVLCSFETEVE